MNCTKCGKEIPEEEGKTICDECQKSLLEEIKIEEEKVVEEKDSKKKEKKTKNNNVTEKVEDKTEVKEESSKKTKKNKGKKIEEKSEEFKVATDKDKKSVLPKILLIIAIIAILVGIALYCMYAGIININTVGSRIGNIRNYGYAVEQGNRIYYLAPNELSTKVGIFSVNKDGEDKKEIFMNDTDILSLNIYGNYLYFITIIETNETGEYDNKICRVKKDGTDFEVINDNEFNDYCYEIYAVKNKIYYIGEDSNVYKMNLDGSNRELVSAEGTGYVGITDKYIIYNDYVQEPATEEEKLNLDLEYKTCIMNLDGSNKRDIVEGKRMYTVNIYEDTVYYTDFDLNIHKCNIDGTNDVLISETEAYNLNVHNGYIYYLNYADIENGDETICIYRVNLDGTDEKEIARLETGTSFINVVGDWVLHMDSSFEAGYMKLTKIDGSEQKEIYKMDFQALYEEYSEVLEQQVTAEETNTISNETTNSVVNNYTPTNISNTENVVNNVVK